MALVVKNTTAGAGDIDMSLIPGLGISPGEGNGNTLQYSCLENLMGRGAWRTTVLGHQELDTTEATLHAGTHDNLNHCLLLFIKPLCFLLLVSQGRTTLFIFVCLLKQR